MKRVVFLIIPFILLSCAQRKVNTTEIVRPAFSGDTAYRFVEHQVRYGARVPGSNAHKNCMFFLINMLRNYGAEVEIQQGTLPNFAGEDQIIYNVIGHFGSLSASNRLLLAAHYDSRPWCDEEVDYDDRQIPLPGANDGASGVGVLLEVARQISKDSAFSFPVDIVFLDCEDMGTPAFYTGQQRENTWCLGSQLFSRRILESGANRKYLYGVVLDMVGAPDAVFPKEYYSMQLAPDFVERVWHQAATLGYGGKFTQQLSYPITDDHYYINAIASVPCIDIIHYDMDRESGFPDWWHTRRDDMSNISPATLQMVGEVVMSLMH